MTDVANDGVAYLTGRARFVDANTVSVSPTYPDATGGSKEVRHFTADRILIAVGGKPTKPDLEGANLGFDSDGFFLLKDLPKKVVVVGAGYIAVELAGIMHTLGQSLLPSYCTLADDAHETGAETHLLIRKDKILKAFDPLVVDTLQKHMVHTGIHLHTNTNVTKVTTTVANPDLTVPFPKTVHIDSGDAIEADVVLWAIGREALTKDLGIDKVGVKLQKNGDVIVDEFQKTNVDNIFAIGDVGGVELLTPVAIAAGRRLSNRLYGGVEGDKLDYNLVPTVVFSHPTIGTVGLVRRHSIPPHCLANDNAQQTEAAAIAKYGESDIKVYKSTFTALYYSMMEPDHKEPTAYKLIVQGKNEKVVGLHLIGQGSDEMMQGFAVAIKMGGESSHVSRSILM